MTKRELRAITKSIIEDEWSVFEDKSLKEIYLLRLKDKSDDIVEIVNDLYDEKFESGEDYIFDMYSEASFLE